MRDKVYRTPEQRRKLKQSQQKAAKTRKLKLKRRNRIDPSDLVFRHLNVSASFTDGTTLGFEKHYITRSDLKGAADIVAFVMAVLPKAQADMLFEAFKPSAAK